MQTTTFIGMYVKCGLERSFMNDQQHNKIYSEKKKNNALVSLKSQACIGDTANTNSTCRKYDPYADGARYIHKVSAKSSRLKNRLVCFS